MHRQTSKPTTASVATPDHREKTGQQGFIDSHGCHWTVYERSRRQFDGGVAKVLVFECDASIRCVRDYPRNWQTLSGQALEQVSWDL